MKTTFFKQIHLIMISIFFIACPKIEPPDDKKEIELTQSSLSLSLESQWTTSLKIKATVLDTTDSFTFELLRDDSTVGIYTLENTPRDTILSDGPLTPASQYQYHAFVLEDDNRIEYSDTISVMTMDTTSHDFVWEFEALGTEACFPSDIWIVNESEIYVVGQLRRHHGDPERFNLAKYDGFEWEYQKVGSAGSLLNSIFYFSENDIWLTDICEPYHWDGNVWTRFNLGEGFNNCVGSDSWGSSSSSMWFVGPYRTYTETNVIHYNGSSFIEYPDLIDAHFINIHGLDENNIWMTGSLSSGELVNSALLFYNGQEWTVDMNFTPVDQGSETGEQRKFSDLWVFEDSLYVILDGNILKKSINTGDSSLIGDYNKLTYITGNSYDDLFFANRYKIFHYNGNTIREILDTRSYFGDFYIAKIFSKNNMIGFVGSSNTPVNIGIVGIGYR